MVLLGIVLWYEEGKVWEWRKLENLLGLAVPGKLSYDDEIATSWLSCKLGPVPHKGTVGPCLLSGLQGQTQAKESGSAGLVP